MTANATSTVWTRGNWRPIPGHPGCEVSYSGRIRVIDDGKPRIIRPDGIGPCGFYTVQFRKGERYHQIGKLVAAAWIGPRPEGASIRYLDGNLQNHNGANLAYGTRKEFYQDQADRARREEAAGAPTHCSEGHRYTDKWFGGWGERFCKFCRRADHAARYVDNTIQTKPCKHCGDTMEDVPYRQTVCDTCAGRGVVKAITTKPCKWCGETMHDVPYQREVCHDCRHPNKVFQTKPCKRCGSTMPNVHHTRLYCDPCKAIQLAESRAKTRAHLRNGPRYSECIDCGTTIENAPQGPKATRCPEHKKDAQRSARRRHDAKRRTSGNSDHHTTEQD